MKTLLICLTPFLMMLATAGLLSSGCTKPAACTPEAGPPPPPDVAVKELTTPAEFPRALWQTRVESEKVTCWVITGGGSGISCLSDAQRKVTP